MSASDERSREMYALNYSKPGTVLIFNCSKFETRPGLRLDFINQDVKELEKLFQKDLKFTVETFSNQTADDTEEKVKYFAKQKHEGDVCLICFIMSRGEDGKILASDNSTVKLDDFINAFKTNATLANKPKIVFVQTCNNVKERSSDPAKDSSAFLKISIHDDDLLCYQVEGPESSLYNQQGSFFFQALCEAIRSNPVNELSQILRTVSNSVEQKGFRMPKVEKTLSKRFHFKVSEIILCMLMLSRNFCKK